MIAHTSGTCNNNKLQTRLQACRRLFMDFASTRLDQPRATSRSRRDADKRAVVIYLAARPSALAEMQAMIYELHGARM